MYRLPLDEAELLLERAKPVINAHVSDASERTAHLVLGDGDYDFGGRLRKLALRYSGPVVVEGNDPRLGVSALPRIAAAWRDAISAPP
jgi:sugar phosphate isomerase/epimerase